MNEKGEASGLRVREGYVFSRNADDDWANSTGVMKTIRARQAVVFATGGYAQDKAFRSSEVPFLAGVVSTTNAGATRRPALRPCSFRFSALPIRSRPKT